jgi:uncharacterized membrane protein YdjX (TVP38/TMEM64 family)
MKRPLLFVAGIAGIVIVTKLVIENMAGVDLVPLATAWITQPSLGSAATVVGLLTIDLVLPVPSSVVMVLSGVAFGTLWGAVLSVAGSLAGSWIGFELVQRYGQTAALRIVDASTLRRLQAILQRYGTWALVVSRALPIVMETMSVVAGLSAMKRSTFLLATSCGTLPVALVYAYAGSVSRETGSIVPATVILIAVTSAGVLWYRSRLSPRPHDRAAAASVSRDVY